MKIHIITQTCTLNSRIQEAVDRYPDISLLENTLYLKGKQIARYEEVANGVEVTVIDKPWYISETLIEFRLRELFA